MTLRLLFTFWTAYQCFWNPSQIADCITFVLRGFFFTYSMKVCDGCIIKAYNIRQLLTEVDYLFIDSHWSPDSNLMWNEINFYDLLIIYAHVYHFPHRTNLQKSTQKIHTVCISATWTFSKRCFAYGMVLKTVCSQFRKWSQFSRL